MDSLRMARPCWASRVAFVAASQAKSMSATAPQAVQRKWGVSVGGGLVHRRTLTRDIEFEHIAELVQPRETAVNRREADPGTELARPLEHVLCPSHGGPSRTR